jgi:hypothetical protein
MAVFLLAWTAGRHPGFKTRSPPAGFTPERKGCLIWVISVTRILTCRLDQFVLGVAPGDDDVDVLRLFGLQEVNDLVDVR